jgi:phosphomannomutase
VAISDLRPLKIVVNCGNGAAGPTFDALAHALSASTDAFDFTRMFHSPDSSFPNGIPNPLLAENHAPTRDQVLAHNADLGIAFDGDSDRCFFLTRRGGLFQVSILLVFWHRCFLKKRTGCKDCA